MTDEGQGEEGPGGATRKPSCRLVSVRLDEASIERGTPDQEHERQIAVYDYAAIRPATAAQIEAIDMGRRGIHNEAADIVIERLKGKVEVDFPTARRLFTLLAALSWTGRET